MPAEHSPGTGSEVFALSLSFEEKPLPRSFKVGKSARDVDFPAEMRCHPPEVEGGVWGWERGISSKHLVSVVVRSGRPWPAVFSCNLHAAASASPPALLLRH